MTLSEKYIAGLKQAYYNQGGTEIWDHFEKIKHGAANEDLEALKKTYPEIPDALIDLLKYVDGTYWREYAGEEIAFYFLGSDMGEYPYYLLSSKEMVADDGFKFYGEYIDDGYEEIDEKITDKSETLNWLHFSDCMNNGGTSQLFIDFSPSEKGKRGQIVRFVHDPDEFKVIADSFEDYLKLLMDEGYDFIQEDVLE